MANTCRTTYICEGTPEQINDLNKALTAISNMENPYVENGWGTLWLGCLIEYLGGKWREHVCRGEIVDFNIIDFEVNGNDITTVEIVQETAWREQEGVRCFLEQHYPGMKIYWQDEESGCDWYATNDEEGRYFTDKYYLDCYKIGDTDYFDNLSSAIKAVEEIIERPLNLSPDTDPDTATDIIRKALLDYIDGLEDEDAYAWFSYFSIVKD